MDDGTGLAEALLGLPDFRIINVLETSDELIVPVESTAARVGCPTCGVRAEAQDRMRVEIRDLPCFGRPAGWCGTSAAGDASTPDCPAKTWTEHSAHVDAQAVITRRAGAEACRQVGELQSLTSPHRCRLARIRRGDGGRTGSAPGLRPARSRASPESSESAGVTVTNAVIEHGTSRHG